MRGARLGFVLAVLLGAALRLYPILHPYPGIELQEHFPRNAILSFVRRNWAPFALHHGSGFFYVLRVLYMAWFALGRLTGVYQDRLDLLAAYVRNPFPFVLTGRLVEAGASILTIVLIGRLGRRLFSPAAGAIGALLLAVAFTHVRESHQVWLDVPAAALALITALAGLRAVERNGAGVWLAAALGGATLACKHSASPIILTVVLIALAAGPRTPAAVMRRVITAGLLGLAAYALLSPYGLLRLSDTLAALRTQASITYGPPGGALPLQTLIDVDLGRVLPALAVIGLVAAARRMPLTTAIVATFPVVYFLLLVPGVMLYARYLAMVAPFAALYGGYGAVLVGSVLLRRRPLVAATAIALIAAAGPFLQSVGYVRLLGREDTRALAGAWIAAHVPPGTRLTLPNAVPYPNPLLPPDAGRLALDYPQDAAALRARGLGDPTHTWPAVYLKFFGVPAPGLEHPTALVVTTRHPKALWEMNPPPEFVDRLRARGARPLAEFTGFPEPLPDGVIYDPVEADYVPLRGAEWILRPGPDITIWEVPPEAPAAAR